MVDLVTITYSFIKRTTMSEIHNEASVIRTAFPNKESLIIFDVGACNFYDSLYLRQEFPNANIYAFEPDNTNLANCPIIVEQSYINVVPVALSDHDDTVVFYPSVSYGGNDHKASGSILKPKTRLGTTEGAFHDTLHFDLKGYDVQTVRIDTFCELNDIAHIDFLHMDVQGAEMKVLGGLGNIRPTFVFAETCEFDTYESGTTLDAFNNYMSNLGYGIVKQFRDDTLYKLRSFNCSLQNHNWLPKL